MTTNLQFVPFSSSVDPAFWSNFTKLKLNDLKLNVEPLRIQGVYSSRSNPNVPPIFSLQFDSFSNDCVSKSGEISAPGWLVHTNTLEEFKKRDKIDLLKTVVANDLWKTISSGEAEADPSSLASFLVFMFADLKKYHYYYWFAFPVFAYPKCSLKSPAQTLKERLPHPEYIKDIQNLYQNCNSHNIHPGFFALVREADTWSLLPLNLYAKEKSKQNLEVWLGFSDPSSVPDIPGWPLRNLLTLAAVRWKEFTHHTILCLRETTSAGVSSIEQSLVLDVEFSEEEPIPESLPSCLGWEKNERSKLGPRFVDLNNTMDPIRLAESAVELNLKLMRWRIVPNLDLPLIRKTRCLLFGAGTLGCNVARCLLGWGIHQITLIDSGKVSFSNPVRQSLFNFEDCNAEGTYKASAAANALKRIYPAVKSEGVVMMIPMPGHSVSPNQEEELKKEVVKLEELIEQHDVLFLLTDSRESRWLPTLIGAVKQKIVLTAALGFDSFVVLRHGLRPSDDGESGNLGCYFCNDVVAPVDSTQDRTLDQQCTVTRPGMSFMAAGHIVELMISLLQHPLKALAPCSTDIHESDGVLGVVPHSIRYFLGRMQHLATSTPPFVNCSACSTRVCAKYKEDGSNFIFKVLNSPSYLEEVSGLSQLHEASQPDDLWEMSDLDDEDLE